MYIESLQVIFLKHCICFSEDRCCKQQCRSLCGISSGSSLFAKLHIYELQVEKQKTAIPDQDESATPHR